MLIILFDDPLSDIDLEAIHFFCHRFPLMTYSFQNESNNLVTTIARYKQNNKVLHMISFDGHTDRRASESDRWRYAPYFGAVTSLL